MKHYLYLIFLILISISCKKANEDLIIGVWKIETVEITDDGINYIIDEDNCLSDDYYIFKKNGELEYNRGIICAGIPDDKTTWYLKNNGKTIAYIYEGYVGEYYAEIIELTKKTLITTHGEGAYKYTFSKE